MFALSLGKESPYFSFKFNQLSMDRGGYSTYPWVGRCGPAPYTLTLFKTKVTDSPTLFKSDSNF